MSVLTDLYGGMGNLASTVWNAQAPRNQGALRGPYGTLDGITPQSIMSSVSPLGAPASVPQPLVLSGGQGGGGDTVPTPPPRPADLGGQGTPTQPTAAPLPPQAPPMTQPASTVAPTVSHGLFSSSPFERSDPNSFISKIFGPKPAHPMPLVSPNSIVGRVAGLFVN